MKLENFFLAILMVATIGNFLFDYEAYKRDLDAAEKLESFNHALMYRIIQNEIRIDSIKTSTQKVATAAIYLDSCQQAKASKSERAERRGKFVGGLLRGLIPGI